MRRLLTAALVFALACGGSTTGLEDDNLPSVAAAIEIEQGADQSARPEKAMPDSVVGRATSDAGAPIEGQLVNFEVVAGSEAGTFEVSSLLTDAEGRVYNELRAGTRAWTSRVVAGEDSAYTARLVASKEGRPDEVRTFTFSVMPGDPVVGPERTQFHGLGGGVLGHESSPKTLPFATRFAVVDQWDNPVSWGLDMTAYAHAEETDDRFGGLRTVVADSAGCAPFYIRTDGGRGVVADSGVVAVTENNDTGEMFIEMTVGGGSSPTVCW